MGAAMSYVAIKDKPDSALLKSLYIEELADGIDLREFYGADTLMGSIFKSGWFIITSYGDPEALLSPKILKRLSAKNRLVTCDVEEHVMCSSATGWIDGKEIWSVVYDSQEDQEAIVITGEPPSGYAEMADALRQVEWFFNIPTELVHNICGFEYLNSNLFPHFDIDF